jgi:hypothetical protein
MVRIPGNGDGGDNSVGVLRLRKTIRGANLLASLRMTNKGGRLMCLRASTFCSIFCRIAIVALMGSSGIASAATYYVSSSSGSDSNSGTSSSSAWATVGHVNGLTFSPGDSILFKRGDVWNESLAPPSSGSSGNPITFDAYGTGAPPNLTGYYAVPRSVWQPVTTNAWKAPLPTGYTAINFCLFGSIWGQKEPVSTANLTANWDFYLSGGFVYVYTGGGNPADYYGGVPIVPMAVSNVPLININSQSWLTFQHILVNWFDQYGVYVQGTSDHLVFANMEADSMIPQGTQPLGFYVNESAPGPGDVKIYNSEAHMNYDGFRFDGVASAITLVNDKGYANRDGALVDNTGAVTYSYSHFYASSLAVAGSTDVEAVTGPGATAGAGNIAADTPPAVQAWQRYPARVTLTVDDAGMTNGTDSYYSNTVLPIGDAAGVQVGVAITVGYALAQTLISEFQGWIGAGRDVTSHSISHTYYPNTDGLDIQYTGSGSSAALSISGKVLSITVPGTTDSVSCNLDQTVTTSPCRTIEGLEQLLTGTGHFTAVENPVCQGPYGTGCSYYTKSALLSQDLADVSGVNVKSAVYAMQLDVTRLTTDEITLSRSWMTTNLTGLPGTPVYVYPGGYELPAMQAIASGIPYGGARGALKEDLGTKDTYATGFDIQNVTSFGVNPSWQGLAPSVLQQKIQALIWKEQVWGVPWGVFWHLNELTPTEITNLIGDFKADGATIMKNTDLVNWLATGTLESGTDGNFYYKSAATSMTLAFAPTASSPVIDAGLNLGTAYQLDINGINQNSYGSGWEIGAHAYIPGATYGGNNLTTGSHFTVGGTPSAGTAQLPVNWVKPAEVNPTGGTYDVTRTATTFAQLQQAICDWVAAPDQWWLVKVPHGTVIDTAAPGYTCTQTGSVQVFSLTLMTKIVSGAQPTKFLVFDSDTPLSAGQTVCSQGITDTTATRQPPSGAITTWWSSGNNGCSNDIGSMWTLEGNWSPGNLGLLIQAGPWDATTNLGPSHYAFKDAEFRPKASLSLAGFVVNTDVGAGGTTPTMTSQMASHIHFMNIYGHGDATDWNGSAGGPGNNKISSFLKMANCSYCSVTYSYVDYVTSTGAESHVVSADKSPGPLLVADNWLSGASSAVFTGGIAATDSFYSVYDMTVVQNRLTNPASWVGSGYGGSGLVIKNRSEIKSCVRCVFNGNIAEYVDTSGAQQGECFAANPRACSNSLQCDNYQVAVQDVTYTNNVCRHALTGFTLAGRSNYPANGGGAAGPIRRVNISNNLLYDLGNGPFYDAATTIAFPYGMRTTIGGQAFICSGTKSSGTITLNCAAGPTGLLETQISAGDPIVVTSCSDSTWNTPGGSFTTQRGALAGTGTNPIGLTVVYANSSAVNSSATGCVVQNLEGFPSYMTFAHNTVVMQTTAGGRNNGRMYSGSTANVYSDTGCSGTGTGPQNSATITALTRAGGIVTATVSSLTGWPANLNSGSQTIVEVLSSGDFAGTFYYLGQSGGNLQWVQAGTNETGTTLGTVQQMGTCPNNEFLENNTWKNNLLAFDVGTAPSCPGTPSTGWTGWVEQGDGNAEGCASGASANGCSENEVDVSNSVVTYTDFPGRCSASYMEVGGAHANANPPVTMTFPAATVCSGAVASSACVGLRGMMSGAAFDANDSDYHNYALAPSSVYKNASDDGTDLGASITAIDNALTQAVYP